MCTPSRSKRGFCFEARARWSRKMACGVARGTFSRKVWLALPSPDDEIRFCAVILEGVDLAVQELAFEKCPVTVVGLRDGPAQAREGEVFAEAGEPILEILPADRNAVLAAHGRGGVFESVEPVVFRDRVENHAQGKALVLVDEGREFLFAVAAVKKLDFTIFVSADAFADDAATATVRTGGGGFDLVERCIAHGAWFILSLSCFFVSCPGLLRIVGSRVLVRQGPRFCERAGGWARIRDFARGVPGPSSAPVPCPPPLQFSGSEGVKKAGQWLCV
jgi:hypothetical protein